MRKYLIATLAASTLLSGCGAGPKVEADLPVTELGRDYILVWGFNLPARDGYAAVAPPELTLEDINDLRSLNAQCHARVDPQIPSAASEIGKPTLRTGAAGALGTGLGAIAAFTGVGFGAYALYGGIASLTQGANAAVDRYNLAKRYAHYACMQWAVSYVQKTTGRFPSLGVLPWAGSGRAVAPVINVRGVTYHPLAQQPRMDNGSNQAPPVTIIP